MSEYNLNFVDGLIPVVVQDYKSGDVLTLAYMNKEALDLSLKTGYAHYYSRSKNRIRMKGEASGNTQKIIEIQPDCENNSLLLLVDQKGPACHTGNKTCFYRKLGEPQHIKEKIDYSLDFILDLENIINETKKHPRENSYTTELFKSGEENIKKKVGEEAVESVLAQGRDRIIYEVADLMYHLLVYLSYEDIKFSDIVAELSRRNVEKSK